jgi:hypothetical protein
MAVHVQSTMLEKLESIRLIKTYGKKEDEKKALNRIISE